MGSFSEMLGLRGLDTGADGERAARVKRLAELLGIANTPDTIAEVPVEPQQSFSGNMADSVLAGFSDGLTNAANILSSHGGGAAPDALDSLMRLRQYRQ